MQRLAILISGSGRNLQALLDHCQAARIPAQVVAVICNRPGAAGIGRARAAGVPVHVLPHADFRERADFDAALADLLAAQAPDIVALAGFMRVLGPGFVGRFEGRLLNIHPSLLPKYPGLDTHRRALAAGDAEHGATVHFVTGELDGGAPVIQGKLSVLPQDDAVSLAERVMQDIELKIYPQAVAWMARRELVLSAGQVLLRGVPLRAPVGLDALEPAFR